MRSCWTGAVESLFRDSAKTFLVLSLGLAIISAPPASASPSDTTPPVLTGFTFSPVTVNTTTSPAAVTVKAQVTDDLSGVKYAAANFRSPSRNQGSTCSGNLISGTDLNGTWQCEMTIPAFSEAGTWTVLGVEVIDSGGNTKSYNTSDLQALGFPIQLEVTSNQDVTAPVLTGFTFSPVTVNTTTSPAAVMVTAQVTDDLSGVMYAGTNFQSPSRNQASACSGSLISGTDLNGTWQCEMTIPAFSEAGTWTVLGVEVIDSGGNTKSYNTSDLQALGFSTQLIVDSTTTLTLTSSVNPAAYLQSITFATTVTASNGSTPADTVNFYDGSTLLGTGTLNGSAITTLTTSRLSGATHSVTAEHLGDSNNPAGISSPLSQVVTQAAIGTVAASSLDPSPVFQPPAITLTFAERLKTYGRSFTNPEALIGPVLGASIGQLRDTPPEWGNGADGFGRRLASSYCRSVIARTIGFGVAAVDREDPRFTPSNESGIWRRTRHAVVGTFVSRTSSGGTMPAFSRFAGAYGAGFIANTWEPPSQDNTSHALERGSTALLSSTGWHIFEEFRPDIRNAFHHRRD